MNNKNTQYLLIPFLLMSILLLPQVAIADSISTVDWDNDGLSDEVEKRIGSGVYLSDTDGDGISDKDEIGSVTKPRDTDKDGRIDILDFDDDGDGIPSVLEGTIDTDKDGKANYLDVDSDGDGLADGFEVKLTGKDSNQDGIDDLFDVEATKGQDVNGDGIDDHVVFVDSNKNGVPDVLDKKSSTPHLKQRVKDSVSVSSNKSKSQKKSVRINENKPLAKPVVVAAAKLPAQMMKKSENKNKEHRYTEKNKQSINENGAYGGSGYFYCGNTGKIVKGIKGFMMTPPGKVTLLRDASEGDYKWRVEVPGTYALQFQIPAGMSIVRGLAKGRRIIKEGDAHPLILGGDVNPAKKGYVLYTKTNVWYTSFEIKDNGPLIKNNNIPLAGGVCDR